MECKKLTDCSPCTFRELNTVKECQHTGYTIQVLCDKTHKHESCKAATHTFWGLIAAPILLVIMLVLFYRYVRRLYNMHILKTPSFNKV